MSDGTGPALSAHPGDHLPGTAEAADAGAVGYGAGIESRLLGRPASMGRRDISREAQVSLRSARKLWHALGFQIVDDEEAMFTEADLEALKAVARILRDYDVDEDLVLGMARALARTSDRLAVWQTQLVAESLGGEVDESTLDAHSAAPSGGVGVRTEAQRAQDAAERMLTLADEIEPLLVYVWRRHLTSAITRMLADANSEQDQVASAPYRVVGFADLVNFTALVQRLTERQIAALVQRFERLASDVVTTHGGRIIKTVGDEVLFLHADPAAASAIALDLVDAMNDDDLLPEVRVGMAYGKVVSRLGDVFGTTVNRASRLTGITPPSEVYVDEVLGRALGTLSGFTATPQRRRALRGLGTVVPARLSRAAGDRHRPWNSGFEH